MTEIESDVVGLIPGWVGTVIGVACLIALVVGLLLFYVRWRRDR